MEETAELMFEGELVTCTRQPNDRGGDYVFESPTGRILKFPKGEDLEANIAKHNEHNAEAYEIAPPDEVLVMHPPREDSN